MAHLMKLYPNQVIVLRKIAKHLKELILEIYPDVVEVPWPKQRIIGYGVGPKKMQKAEPGGQ